MTLMMAMICMNVPELALYDRNQGFQKRFDSHLQYRSLIYTRLVPKWV